VDIPTRSFRAGAKCLLIKVLAPAIAEIFPQAPTIEVDKALKGLKNFP
jgi:hypothetical protein